MKALPEHTNRNVQRGRLLISSVQAAKITILLFSVFVVCFERLVRAAVAMNLVLQNDTKANCFKLLYVGGMSALVLVLRCMLNIILH